MVYRRKHRQTLDVAVPTRTGWIKRSTGTTDRATARAIERMLAQLGPSGTRAWDLLDAIVAKRLGLGALFDAYRNGDLDRLRARLTDVDLAAHIPSWEAWLTDQVKPTTADHYRAHLRTLIPDGQPFWRSALTGPAVARWLAARTALVAKRQRRQKASRRQPDPPARPVSASTKRRYLAAVQSFVSYLREMGTLTTNPLRDLQPPPSGPPRYQFLELSDVVRLIEGSVKPYQAIFALAYGAGLEVSAILAGIETDVSYPARAVRARGTKAWNRDRLAYIADWAWPFVERHLARLLPGERIFRGINRWKASDYHRERLRAFGLPPLRLHDCRHHWAVENLRTGVPVELLARQLGHHDATIVLKVYGRFMPHDVEWAYWRERLAERQASKPRGRGAAGGAASRPKPKNPDEKSPATFEEPGGCDDSRGGTRTRDPGIMSAVL